jgi:hypothetical protein
MSPRKLEEIPSEPLRMDIFKALVEEQDRDVGVARSRKIIADRFDISEAQVKEIEEEGLDNEWPPLGEPPQTLGHG